MSVDREQTRRELKQVGTVDEILKLLAVVERDYPALLAELEQAKRERDEARQAAVTARQSAALDMGSAVGWEHRALEAEAHLAAVPALVEAARSVHESRSDLSLHDGSGTRAVGDYFVSRRALDALAAALAAVEQAQERGQ